MSVILTHRLLILCMYLITITQSKLSKICSVCYHFMILWVGVHTRDMMMDMIWSTDIHFIIRRITHLGRVTHICVSKLIIIGSDNGLSPGRRQAIIWTNAGILLIGPFGTNFSEFLIEMYTFSFKKMHLKMLPGKRRPCCLGLNVIMGQPMAYIAACCERHWTEHNTSQTHTKKTMMNGIIASIPRTIQWYFTKSLDIS